MVLGVVKKAVGAVLKIVHADPVPSDKLTEYAVAMEDEKELQTLLPKTKFCLLNPSEVYGLLSKVRLEVQLLFFLLSLSTLKFKKNSINSF